MARAETWINADGLEVGFGPVVANNTTTGPQEVKGKIKQLEQRIDVEAGLVSVGDTISQKHSGIPAGAYIVSATYVSETDFDAAVEFGTAQADGTAIDQDGLITTGTTTAEGAGVLIGTVTSEVNYIVVTATTTAPTAGKGQLVVEYII